MCRSTAKPSAWECALLVEHLNANVAPADLFADLGLAVTDAVDLEGTSLLIGAVFGDALATVARRRREGSLPDRFGDVRFADLMADPTAAIAGAYEAIGRPFTDEHRRAVVDYLAAKPRGKHGIHRYTAADWGFDVDEVRAPLADYLAAMDVALEA